MPRRVKDISAQRLRSYGHAPGPGRELHFTTTVVEGPANTIGRTVETQLTKDEVTSLLICLAQNSGYEHLIGDILRLIGGYRSEKNSARIFIDAANWIQQKLREREARGDDNQ